MTTSTFTRIISCPKFAFTIGFVLAITIIIISWYKTSQKIADNTHQYCSQPLKSPSYYQSYIQAEIDFRSRFLQKLKPFLQGASSPWRNNWGIYFWDAFIPTMTCPHFLSRVGGPAGGGKWVCGFELYTSYEQISLQDGGFLDVPCVLYSFGVGPDSSFEAEFLSRTNCSVHMFDHTIGAPAEGPGSRLPPGMEHRWTFENKGLGNKESHDGIQTLGHVMRTYGHKWIDFLKVDIEWSEYSAFNQIMEEFEIFPFGQLNLEIHLQARGDYFF
ncbi:Methyltransferase-like protein 24 [Folsomia candida]|uniref:Methyltransferase-like protein 24 n=1 Tax=Folsomia candida TaxID=158441 RepID=A0A226E8L0_FOLCA|nr:Methyltransferase-like protein 24 [Folsomia candida]